MATPWSSKGSKATPVGADELLIIDSADANPATTNKLITIGSMPFVANPLISDLDADGNALLDANYLEVGSSLATPFADDGHIRLPDFGVIAWRNQADDGNFTIVVDDQTIAFNSWETIEFPDATILDCSSADVTMNTWEASGECLMNDGSIVELGFMTDAGNNPATVGFIQMSNNVSLGWSNFAEDDDLELKVNVSDEFEFSIFGTPEYAFGATVFTIADANNIAVGTTTGTQIGTASTQLLGFYGTTAVNQPDALTAQDTTLTSAAPGSPDFAIQTLTQTSPFGFVTSDEAQTVLQVIANLQTRVQELEDRLEELGLIAAN